jgi:protein-tyrosine phosphatase
MTSLLFVCLGNICRSPAAEGVFAKLARDAGWAERLSIDSAGTAGYHEGERADERMRSCARKRGYELTSIARAVVRDDFERFDRILAMDRSNLVELQRRAPAQHRDKIRLYRDYDSIGRGEGVPDPYYGGPEGFDEVLDIVERCGRALLDEIRAAHGR